MATPSICYSITSCTLILFSRSLCHARVIVFQCFGIAEGRPKEDMKNMANASGMACCDYTPPGGETFDQVSHLKEFQKSGLTQSPEFVLLYNATI